MYINLNDLLPKQIKQITTGSELLLAYELNKYTKSMFGKRVTLSGIKIHKALLTTEDFSFVVFNGLDVGFKPDITKLVSFGKSVERYFSGTVEDVYIKEKNDKCWVYSLESCIEKNNKMNKANKSLAYVSLIAYMLVLAYKEGTKCPKLIIDHENHAQLELEYVHLLILKNWGNKILKDLIEVKFCVYSELQPDWEAFVMMNRQRGFMCRDYSIVEKRRVIKRKFDVGDVVLLYTKQKASGGGAGIGKLKCCYPAVIEDITKTTISFRYYSQIDTLTTRYVELSKLDQDCENIEFTLEDYDRFLESRASYDINDIGVDVFSYKESVFFIKPLDFDGSYQYFKIGKEFKKVWLPTLDTIYAVFEDRGVSYNKERFLANYFKDSKPIYDMVMKEANQHKSN